MSVKKILIVRYRFIGDTILTIPFVRNLRKAYPDAEIHYMTNQQTSEILENCPYIDKIIIYEAKKRNKDGKSFFEFVKLLKKEKYDKAYLLKRSLSSAAMTFLAGIKHRIGFNTEYRGFLLTKRVKYRQNIHESENFLNVLRADGIEITDNHLENWLSAESVRKIESLLAKKMNNNCKYRILIHASSTNRRKQWPVEHFARLIEYLSNEKKAQIIHIGTNNDSKIYDEIKSHITGKLDIEPINLCGSLSIQDSTALVNKLDLVIGVDSGINHVAASLNIPVIALFGPMNSEKWRPFSPNSTVIKADLSCIPCELKQECKDNYKCMKEIYPEMLMEKANKILSDSK